MRALLAAAVLSLAAPAIASGLDVMVIGTDGSSLEEAVVWAIPDDGHVPEPTDEAVMDQKNRMFVPHVLAVQTGTAVRFPNSDDVRHQVYSFSPPKRFQLPLYEGSPAEPVVFDKPGIVSLGCNIHDRMSAYIVVVDTPWFDVTEDGRAELRGLKEGTYSLHVWHARLGKDVPPRPLVIRADETKELTITLGAD